MKGLLVFLSAAGFILAHIYPDSKSELLIHSAIYTAALIVCVHIDQRLEDRKP